MNIAARVRGSRTRASLRLIRIYICILVCICSSVQRPDLRRSLNVFIDKLLDILNNFVLTRSLLSAENERTIRSTDGVDTFAFIRVFIRVVPMDVFASMESYAIGW